MYPPSSIWKMNLFECDFSSDLKLMQYTGLKDKNGKSIFEDDIVVRKGWDTNSEEYYEWAHHKDFSDGVDEALEAKIPIIDVVTDVVTMARFPVYWLKNEEFGYEGDDLEEPEKFEIIGNIYENPELIK